MNLYVEIVQAQKENRACALATIVNTVGCAPRSAGTKMLVYSDGSISGSVGGGIAERMVIRDALACIQSGRPVLKRYSPQTIKEAGREPDCEKIIDVFIDPGESRAHLVILGSGHVAQTFLRYAKNLGYYVTIVDTRELSECAEALSGADQLLQAEHFDSLPELGLGPGAFYLICTATHAEDGEALGAVLQMDAAYIGMLGSKHKFLPIFKRLREDGYTDEKLMEVYAPVGLDIGGSTLDEIAVSVMAELQMVRYRCSGIPMRDKGRSEYFG